MNARDKSYDESLGAALLDPVEAATYLEAVLELDDPAALLLALRQVAKAHGMAEVARRAELGEKTLFKALSENGNPIIATVHKVLHAVGLTEEHALELEAIAAVCGTRAEFIRLLVDEGLVQPAVQQPAWRFGGEELAHVRRIRRLQAQLQRAGIAAP